MRFLQTDPIPGGSANAYDYALQDPINQSDLNGLCVAGLFGSHCHNAVARFIHRAARPLVQYLKFRWQHEQITYGGCLIGCLFIGFQSGHIFTQTGGIGLALPGASDGYTHRRYSAQNPNFLAAGGGAGWYGAGASVGINRSGIDPGDWSVNYQFRPYGFYAGAFHTHTWFTF